MELPVPSPVRPMLAKKVDALPTGDAWIYEPKWDGFRTLVFRCGDELLLQSRDQKPLNRYFPELEAPLLEQLPERCVLDGEVVIAGPDGLDFPALQNRLHPAESRVARLAQETPAAFVAFDLLARDDRDLMQTPFERRRELLEQTLADPAPPLHVTPSTRDRSVAQDWFDRFEGAGFDGVMAKDPAGIYAPGKRSQLKVKHQRTADCVVAGFRWHKNGEGTLVGSLLLGLFDDQGRLHHVGVAASFRETRRRELVEELAPLREGVGDGHPWADWIAASHPDEGGQRVPGGHSRWSRGKDLSWVPLRAERVVEVSYDNMQGTRFRHTAHFVRWRPDRDPADCRYDQLEVTAPVELGEIFTSD